MHAGCGYDGSGALDYHALVGRWHDRNGARGSSGLVVNLGARTVTLSLADFYSAAGAKVDIWSAPADAEPDDTVAPATHTEITVDASHHTISIPPRAIVRWHDLGG